MSESAVAPKIVQNPNPAVPLAALVQFDAPDFGGATVSIGDGRHARTLHFDDRYDLSQGLPILGLYEGQQVDISAKDGQSLGTFDFPPIGDKPPAFSRSASAYLVLMFSPEF